jgi:hypothetical protein
MILTQTELKEILNYNPDTGIFSWNICKRGVKKDSIAGSITPFGYSAIRINGKSYQAHRLAWLYTHGSFPNDHIDHIDHNKLNNRLNNLRCASCSENLQNQIKAHYCNKTGLLGAYKIKDYDLFTSKIMINRKSKHLGCFKTAMEAHEAYIEAKRKIHDFCTI